MDKFKILSEIAFNITKVLAVLFAGIWTIYQWDKVLFPKETHAEFVRKASIRTDVVFREIKIIANILSDETDLANFKGNIVQLDGGFQVLNQTDFPLSLSAEQVQVSAYGLSIKTGESKLDGSSIAGLLEFNREPIFTQKIDPIKITKRDNIADPLTVESKADFIVSVSEFLTIPKNLPYEFVRVELGIVFKVSPIDPVTNTLEKSIERIRSLHASFLMKNETLIIEENDKKIHHRYLVPLSETGNRSLAGIIIGGAIIPKTSRQRGR